MSDEDRETVRPNLMAPREKVEFHTASGNLPVEIEGLLDRLAVHASASEQVQNPRWSDEHQERLVAELESQLHPDVAALIERTVAARTKDLDREEGALRADAAFTAEVDAGVASKASLMATQVAAADAKAAIDTFEDAIFTDNTDLVRTVGGAVLSRLKELAAVDKGKPLSEARNVLLVFEQRWADWRRSHPSPRERLAQIERERQNRRTQIEETAKVILRLHGIGRPAAPPPQLRTMPTVVEETRVREGRAFDLFDFDRLPGRVRR